MHRADKINRLRSRFHYRTIDFDFKNAQIKYSTVLFQKIALSSIAGPMITMATRVIGLIKRKPFLLSQMHLQNRVISYYKNN